MNETSSWTIVDGTVGQSKRQSLELVPGVCIWTCAVSVEAFFPPLHLIIYIAVVVAPELQASGYLAPEWLTSQITEKADIYSFGVVVMEIISGRKNLDYSQPQESIHLISILQDKVRNDQLEDLIGMNGNEMQIHKEEMIQMMKLAMWCLQIDYNKRPQMSVVVKVLEGTMNVETNIEFNFVATVPGNLGNDGKLASSAPLLASHLSDRKSVV